MRSKLFLGLMFLTASFYANAQTTEQKTAPPKQVVKSEMELVKPETANEKNTPDISDNSNQTSNQNSQIYTRPDKKTRFNRYVNSVVGPTSLAKNAASAGFSTWRNSPEEWGPTWEGFGRRFASSVGKGAIKNTTTYALDEAFKLDSHFYRSQKKDFGSRLKNALISTVTARKPNGKRVFGFPRIAGTYTANIVAAETWFPKRYDYKDGLRSGTISLGTNTLFNIVKEFVFK